MWRPVLDRAFAAESFAESSMGCAAELLPVAERIVRAVHPRKRVADRRHHGEEVAHWRVERRIVRHRMIRRTIARSLVGAQGQPLLVGVHVLDENAVEFLDRLEVGHGRVAQGAERLPHGVKQLVYDHLFRRGEGGGGVAPVDGVKVNAAVASHPRPPPSRRSTPRRNAATKSTGWAPASTLQTSPSGGTIQARCDLRAKKPITVLPVPVLLTASRIDRSWRS